jgi:hypothetical protein
MSKALLAFALLLAWPGVSFGQYSSGCHNNLEFWYNTTNVASYLVYTGSGVSQWKDFQTVEGKTYNLIYNSSNSATWPQYVANEINGYGAVEFGSDDYLYVTGVFGADFRQAQAMTVYAVIKTSAGKPIFGHGEGANRVMFHTDALYWGTGYTSNGNGAGNSNMARKVFYNTSIGSTYEIRAVTVSLDIADSLHNIYKVYKDGKLLQTKNALYAQSVGTVTDTFILGAYRNTTDFEGTIAELMVYKDAHDLLLTKRNRITTYLALKYGISLDNSGGYVEYRDQNNKDLWPYSTECNNEGPYSQYSYRVTGIFRDVSCYGIHHNKSTNFSSGSILTGAYTETNHDFDSPDNFNKNRQFFLWGDDNGTSTFQTNGETGDVPTGSGITRMQRKWKIRESINTNPTAGTIEDVTYEFDLSDTDIPGGISINDIYVMVDTDRDGSFTDETAFNPDSWTASTKIGRFEYDYNDCQVFTFGVKTVALPVTWLSFTAQDGGNRVNLDWATASEINNSHFEVERSTNGLDWLQLGQLSGQGTTVGESHYAFSDITPLAGYNYYRIKQVDFDGNYSYSSVELVVFANGNLALSQIYPNPSRGIVQVDLPLNRDELLLNVTDMQGNLQYTEWVQGESTSIDVSHLPKGIYLVHVGKPGFNQVHKLVLE